MFLAGDPLMPVDGLPVHVGGDEGMGGGGDPALGPLGEGSVGDESGGLSDGFGSGVALVANAVEGAGQGDGPEFAGVGVEVRLGAREKGGSARSCRPAESEKMSFSMIAREAREDTIP